MLPDRRHLVEPRCRCDRDGAVEWRVVAVYGLAAARHICLYECGAGDWRGYTDRLAYYICRAFWWFSDRKLGNSNKSVELLYRRASAAVDYPCLAHCVIDD